MAKRNAMLNIMPYDCRYCVQGFKGMVHISDEARARGVELTELQRSQAEKGWVLEALRIDDPIFVTGFGHGNADIFTGNSESEIFHTARCEMLAARVTYLLSCKTAIRLGPSIIQNGGIAYGGYNVNWTWMTSDVTADPYEEFYAEAYYKSSNEFPIALIQGDTLQQANDRSVAKYTEWITIWETERSGDPSSAEVIKYLIMDRDGLVILGDLDATITGQQGTRITFNGHVSAQAAAGEQVTVTINLPDGTTKTVTGPTQEDLSYSVDFYATLPGSYRAKARVEEDALYLAAESEDVLFEITGEKQPRSITLDVTLRGVA